MPKIVVIGSINADYVSGVDKTPLAGETVIAGSFTITQGGKGANQAFALGRMGAEVVMLGAVGLDEAGERALCNLQSAGVDTSHIARRDGHTGMAFITVNASGDNSIIVAPGANRQVDCSYIDSKAALLREADAVVLQLEIPLETVVYTARLAKSCGCTVILDPAPAAKELPEALLACADYCKPNESELAVLSGIPDVKNHLDRACAVLLDKGVGCVLATLGGDGAYAARKGQEGRLFPCEKAEVVDTTAAGDSFTAAIAYAVTAGMDIDSAVRLANRVAAVVVSRKGAQSSIPDKAELAALF